MTPLLWASLVLSVSCGDCEGSSVKNNGENNQNSSTNNDENNDENNENSCVVGTDCPSGLCEDGQCVVGGSNNCSDPGPCGNCDPFCQRDGSGNGDNNDPFTTDDTDDETSEGVVVDDDGSITIDITKIETHYIWISNTGEGTISKVDTRTLEEVARYVSGPDGASNDPSRTSVNTYGEVFVGNRSGMSVTKISPDGEECQDANGDGMITTSTSKDDVLPWGQDDCVKWNVRLANGGVIRAVAAQDAIPNDDTSRPGVWIGGWNGPVWKLDSVRGDILLETPGPTGSNYGFALDGKGNLWISGWSAGAIGRIDTSKCKTTDTCNEPVCTGEDCDDAVKQSIPINHSPYGITVDFKQRVWVGGQNTLRYDPSQPVGQRTVTVSDVPFVHGIAADDKGFIWGAALSNGVIRYDAEDPAQHLVVPGSNTSPKGMAIDLDGKIWAINQSHSDATVIEAGPDLNTNDVTNNVAPDIVSPYTYSDMTGAQLRFATNEGGFYRRIFEGCPDDGKFEPTQWNELRFDVETPGDTSVVFSIRGADSRAGLETAAWTTVATVPPDASPVAIADLLEDAGLQGSQFVEVEAELNAVRDENNNVFAPKLKALEMTYNCERRIN
jgi:streptogramin lyase